MIYNDLCVQSCSELCIGKASGSEWWGSVVSSAVLCCDVHTIGAHFSHTSSHGSNALVMCVFLEVGIPFAFVLSSPKNLFTDFSFGTITPKQCTNAQMCCQYGYRFKICLYYWYRCSECIAKRWLVCLIKEQSGRRSLQSTPNDQSVTSQRPAIVQSFHWRHTLL